MEEPIEDVPVRGASGKHIPHDFAHPALVRHFGLLSYNHADDTTHSELQRLHRADNIEDDLAYPIIELHALNHLPVVCLEVLLANSVEDHRRRSIFGGPVGCADPILVKPGYRAVS